MSRYTPRLKWLRMMYCAGITLADPSFFSPRAILCHCDPFVTNFTAASFVRCTVYFVRLGQPRFGGLRKVAFRECRAAAARPRGSGATFDLPDSSRGNGIRERTFPLCLFISFLCV
ncbi:hypothetical protein EVAR_24006_1 [Eumeta japonica]|uniref:Uncharacterized protein n=1 Tax=Eumeta variegata TaxID=151549 RepID=A0A4C1W8P5_EUMVA|nr:hypothetical protein EVAR_24006_1 [Eumeta japonica]